MILQVLFSLLVVARADDDTVVEKLNRIETRVSARVNSLSEQIDSFFSRDEIETEKPQTRVRVGFVSKFEQFEKPQYNFLMNAKLVLPKTEEKLQLLLLSDEAENNPRAETGERALDRSANEAVQKQKFRLGLRQLFHQSKTSGVALDGGIKIRDPVDPFARLVLRRSFYLENTELHLYDKQYWFESEGWSTVLTVDWDRPLHARWLGRFSNNGELDHESGLWQFNHFLGLYHKFSRRLALGYFAGITSDDEPTLALNTYYVAISSRYALIDDWLFLQVIPEVTWPRERNWYHVPGITLKLESIFGG